MLAFTLMVFLLGIIAFHFNFTAHALEPEWAISALRLSGESTRVSQQSVKKLKMTPQLEKILMAALTENSTHTFLALDVISTLQLKSLLPSVIAAAKKDRSGFFYLTLNSFMAGPAQKQLIRLYESRLSEKETAAPVKMVLLDTLARMNIKVKANDLKRILENEDEPEARSAVLYYLRTFLLKGDHDYDGLWNDLLAESKKRTTNETFSNQLQSLIAELALAGGKP